MEGRKGERGERREEKDDKMIRYYDGTESQAKTRQGQGEREKSQGTITEKDGEIVGVPRKSQQGKI